MGKQRPIDLSGFDEIVKTNKPKELDLSGFDEIVKKKEDFQRGYQFGSKPLSAGSKPSQTQVDTKTPSVLTPKGQVGYQEQVKDFKPIVQKPIFESPKAKQQRESGYENIAPLLSGLQSTVSSFYKIPRYIYDVFAIPQNLVADLANVPELKANYDNVSKGALNPLSYLEYAGDYTKGKAKEWESKQRKYDEDITTQLFKSGDYGGAGLQIYDNVIASAPSIAAMFLSGGVANAAKLGSASSKIATALPFASAQNQELLENQEIPDWLKPVNAAFNGLSEILLEGKFGTTAILSGATKIAAEKGADAAIKSTKDFVYNYIKKALSKVQPVTDVVSNAAEEMATTLSQNIIARATGEDPDRGIMDGVFDAGIVGGAQGAGASAIRKGLDVLANKKSKGKVDDLTKKRDDIVNDLDNDAISDAVKEQLEISLEGINQEINNTLDENRNEINNLPEETKLEVAELADKIETINESLQNETISETSKTILEQDLKDAQAELDAKFKLAKPTIDTEEQIIAEGQQAEADFQATDDLVTYEQKMKELDDRANQLIPEPTQEAPKAEVTPKESVVESREVEEVDKIKEKRAEDIGKQFRSELSNVTPETIDDFERKWTLVADGIIGKPRQKNDFQQTKKNNISSDIGREINSLRESFASENKQSNVKEKVSVGEVEEVKPTQEAPKVDALKDVKSEAKPLEVSQQEKQAIQPKGKTVFIPNIQINAPLYDKPQHVEGASVWEGEANNDGTYNIYPNRNNENRGILLNNRELSILPLFVEGNSYSKNANKLIVAKPAKIKVENGKVTQVVEKGEIYYNEIPKKVEATKPKKDAVQVETAGQVPVLTEAPVGEEVEQGKPQPKAKVVTEEGKEEVVGSGVELVPENESGLYNLLVGLGDKKEIKYSELTRKKDGQYVYYVLNQVGEKKTIEYLESKGIQVKEKPKEAEQPTKEGKEEVGGDVEPIGEIVKPKSIKLNSSEEGLAKMEGLKAKDVYPTRQFFKNKSINVGLPDVGSPQFDPFISENKDNTKEEIVDLSKITPTQELVDKSGIGGKLTIGNPLIVRFNDGLFVLDGHHRISTEAFRGNTKIKADVITIDKTSDEWWQEKDDKWLTNYYRAEEQAELKAAIPNADQYLTNGKVDRDKLTDPKDLNKYDEIYDKYDKLITPLLPKTETTPAKPKTEPRLKPRVETRIKFTKAIELFNDISAADGAAKKGTLSRKRQKFLAQNPSIKYIDDNWRKISDQLKAKGLIETKGNCP